MDRKFHTSSETPFMQQPPQRDIMEYEWSVSGGSLNNNSANPVKWTTPQDKGSYTVNLKVSDTNGGQCNYSSIINVEPEIAGIDIVDLNSGTLQEILSIDVPKFQMFGGTIDARGLVTKGSFIYAGDSGIHGLFSGGEKEERGFICFDTSNLSGKTVTSASLTFNLKKGWGIPWYDSLWLVALDWGPGAITAQDFNLGGTDIQQFVMETGGDFTCSNNVLKTQLQNFVDSGKQYFHLRIQWSDYATDNDFEYDGWEYDLTGINLKVTYY